VLASAGAADQLPENRPAESRRRRATYTRKLGVRYLLAGYDPDRDPLYGHVKPVKGRTQFLAFCRYLRSLYPAERPALEVSGVDRWRLGADLLARHQLGVPSRDQFGPLVAGSGYAVTILPLWVLLSVSVAPRNR
jgi:hypothetical protein